MSRGARHNRDWQERDRVQRMNAGHSQQRDRIKALLSARRSAEEPASVLRPGISAPVAVRFAPTSAPTDWVPADRGQPITTAILDAVEDGHDRVVLAWPGRPGSGFAAAAIALRGARASGRLAYGTLGLWPWRGGATWSARSILVHPGDIAQMGQRAADEILKGADWGKSDLAQKPLYMLELRLQDLTSNAVAPGRDGIVVRSPTLLETTSVFAPEEGVRLSPYACDGKQVLRRVRDYTFLTDGLRADIGAMGDPSTTPFAIFGLPPASRPEALSRYFEFPRLKQMLDAVVVDATRNGRAELEFLGGIALVAPALAPEFAVETRRMFRPMAGLVRQRRVIALGVAEQVINPGLHRKCEIEPSGERGIVVRLDRVLMLKAEIEGLAQKRNKIAAELGARDADAKIIVGATRHHALTADPR